jgi:hypothetical protein
MVRVTTRLRIPSRDLALMPPTFSQTRPVARRHLVNIFSMLIRIGLSLINVMLPAVAVAGSALPKGFPYLREMDPTIVQDIRYAGFVTSWVDR